MNYKATLCACTAMICVAPAFAADDTPSSITLYGQIDEGLQYLNNAAKDSGSVYQVGAGTATSYFGFRGIENLGDGLHVIWDLQGGFSANNGTSSQGPRLFGRQSYVGIEGKYGRLTIGRQYTMRFYATQPINVFGTGAQGITTLDNGVANARADNAISYRVNLTKEFEVGVNYSLGRDAVSATPTTAVATNCPGEAVVFRQCKEMSGLLKYTAETWGVDMGYEKNVGGTAATFGGLTSPDKSDSRLIAGGYTIVKGVRLALGYIRRNNEGFITPKSNMLWATATAPITTNVSVDGMLAELKYDASANKALVYVVRAKYALSKRTFIYITADHIRNSGTLALSASTLAPVSNPVPGGSQLSVITGIRHSF